MLTRSPCHLKKSKWHCFARWNEGPEGAEVRLTRICARADRQGAAACPRSRVPLAEIEGFVVDRIREIGRDPTFMREALVAAKVECEAKRPELLASVRSHEAEARRLAAERSNLINAVAKGGAGANALMRRVGEIDDLVAAAGDKAREARVELVRPRA